MNKKLSTLAIKGKRVENNITQSEMADMLGLSHNGYSQKENGYRKFTPDELWKISQILGVSMDIFFKKIVPNRQQNRKEH